MDGLERNSKNGELKVETVRTLSDMPSFENYRARVVAAERLASLEKPFASMSVGVPGSGKSTLTAKII